MIKTLFYIKQKLYSTRTDYTSEGITAVIAVSKDDIDDETENLDLDQTLSTNLMICSLALYTRVEIRVIIITTKTAPVMIVSS